MSVQNIPAAPNHKPTTLTVNRRFYRFVCGVAAGASSLLLITIGSAGSPSQNPTAAPQAPAHSITVAAPIQTPTPTPEAVRRGPNATEMATLRKAQAANNGACWAEWNEVQTGFEIICGGAPSAAPSTH